MAPPTSQFITENPASLQTARDVSAVTIASPEAHLRLISAARLLLEALEKLDASERAAPARAPEGGAEWPPPPDWTQ